MSLAPVALFVYNRADNMLKTLECLVRNTLASETELYVFSDGGKDTQSWQEVNHVRQELHRFQALVEKEGTLKHMTIIERPENIYLERNIIEGIAQVFEQHDRIIVLEDDICTSTHFLDYMNQAFDLYQDIPQVMHVAGFTHLSLFNPRCPTEGINGEPPVPFYFTPHMAGWGWGTWRDHWQNHFVHYKTRAEALEGLTDADINTIQYGGAFPCLKSLDKDPIPWDCCWELAIYKAQGLCLTPGHTLVRNIGLRSGTHFRSFGLLQYYLYDRQPMELPLPLTRTENPQKDPHIEALFAEAITDWGIRYTPLGHLVRYIYQKITHKK